MMHRSLGLLPDALANIADLEQRVLAVDGGRLKLEWNTLRSRPADQVNDVLWRDGGRLVGFCGMYEFGGDLEIAGMVDPGMRRQGIATALLDAVYEISWQRAIKTALLVVPRSSDAGRDLAVGLGGVLDHSEHALVLTGKPSDGPSDSRITVRTASVNDAHAVREIVAAAFPWAPADMAALLARGTREERTLLIERAGHPVGTVRITHEVNGGIDAGGVYGFAVLPAERGRGIGRDALRRCCRQLIAEGAHQVALEVVVGNEHALGLYTSLGFRPVTTEDYYAIPLSGAAGAG